MKTSPALVLTERDTQLLGLVGLVGYASVEQLAREFFPSNDRARRRIRHLSAAGYVRVTLTDSRAPRLVSLSRKGVERLHALLPDLLPSNLKPHGAIEATGAAHHLAIVDTYLYLKALAHETGHTLNRFANAHDALGTTWGLTARSLYPDGLADLTVQGTSWRLALEIDCGTEGSTVLTAKLAKYRAAMGDGSVDELWWTVAASDQREATLRRHVYSAGLAAVTRVIPHAHLTTRPIQPPPPRVEDFVDSMRSP